MPSLRQAGFVLVGEDLSSEAAQRAGHPHTPKLSSFADEMAGFPTGAVDTDSPGVGAWVPDLLPSLSPWSLLPLDGEAQAACRQPRASSDEGGGQVSGEHWAGIFAVPCSSDDPSQLELGGRQNGGRGAGTHRARVEAAQESQWRPQVDDTDVVSEEADAGYRIVRFSHCKPAAVGVGVFFERIPVINWVRGAQRGEIVRVARLQPGGPADCDGSIRVGDLLLSVDDCEVSGIACMKDLAALVLGDEGSMVTLCLRRSAGEEKGRTYETRLLRSRANAAVSAKVCRTRTSARESGCRKSGASKEACAHDSHLNADREMILRRAQDDSAEQRRHQAGPAARVPLFLAMPFRLFIKQTFLSASFCAWHPSLSPVALQREAYGPTRRTVLCPATWAPDQHIGKIALPNA